MSPSCFLPEGSGESCGWLFENHPHPMWVYDQETLAVLAVNQAAVCLYGYSRDEFLARTIADLRSTGDVPPLLGSVAQGTSEPNGTWQHLKKDGTVIVVEISSHQIELLGRLGKLVMAYDVTQRARAEELAHATNSLLGLAAKKANRKEYLEGVVEWLRGWTGCRCAGIRIVDERGFIPYEAFAGFPDGFWKKENEVILGRHQCVCTRVILGQSAPQERAAMTPGGSFWSCRLTEFARTLSEADKPLYRRVCLEFKFESLAIIPVRHEGRILGAIHLADLAPERLPQRRVEFLESLTPIIGASLHQMELTRALRESENNLRQAERIAHLGYWDQNVATGKAWGSEECFRIFGLDPQAGPVGAGLFLERVHPEDRGRVARAMADRSAGTPRGEVEFRLVLPDGGVRWALSTGEVSRAAAGQAVRWFGTVMDVTERKAAEARIRELALFPSRNPAPVIRVDAGGRIQMSNPAAEAMGVQADALIEEVLPGLRGLDWPQTITSGQKVRREVAWQNKTFQFTIQGEPELGVAQLFGAEITERRQAEEQLRALAARVEAVREEERTHVAREIHDVLAQELTSLKVNVVLLDRLVSAPFPDESRRMLIREKLNEMMTMSDTAIGSVQKIATDLRPAVLDSLGLCAAIEWQVKDFATRTGVESRTRWLDPDLKVDRERSTALFRILQESLTNVTRHAAATRVDIDLESEAGGLRLTIRDNGRGMSPGRAYSARAVGLLGMRERAALLGGRCEITSRLGEGTQVEAWLPWPTLTQSGIENPST